MYGLGVWVFAYFVIRESLDHESKCLVKFGPLARRPPYKQRRGKNE